jgi:glycosyltransferase involved in cell wall biosynthesis
MKKVCFFLTSLDSGGTEKYLLRFLEYSQNNINATIICKSGKLGSLEQDFKKVKANIIPLKTGYFKLFSWIKIYKILKKSPFNSVVDLTGNFGGIPMMVSLFAGIKKRITFYRYSSNQFKETQFRLLYNRFVKFLVFKFATSILSNSKTAFNFFFPIVFEKDKRFKVIFNGVNFNDFIIKESKKDIRNSLGINRDVFLIGHIGRNDISKNHKTIFKVARELIKKDINIEFLFCGKGTDDEEFKKQITDIEILKNVHVLGERFDVPRILKALDIFYFPSITEGQPNALIEAMLCNLPIITSTIEPIKEIIPIEGHNLLIDPYEVSKAVKSILAIRNNATIERKYKYKNWAIKNFNFETNFRIFENEI